MFMTPVNFVLVAVTSKYYDEHRIDVVQNLFKYAIKYFFKQKCYYQKSDRNESKEDISFSYFCYTCSLLCNRLAMYAPGIRRAVSFRSRSDAFKNRA